MDKDKKEKPKIKKKQSPLNWALWMLGRREYSEHELRTKMSQKDWSEEEIEDTLDKIKKNDFQSDKRAAESLTRMSVSQGKGPQYIIQKSRARGISQEDINLSLENEDVDWMQGAMDVAQRKFGDGPYPREIQIKIASLLIRRGFSYDISWRVARISEEEINNHI